MNDFVSNLIHVVPSARRELPILCSFADCDFKHHTCLHGDCIDKSLACDGKSDCPSDNSDEENCPGKVWLSLGLGR